MSQNNEPDNQSPTDDKGPSDLVVGTVAFIIFLIFMTLWMMFVPESK